MYPDLCPSPTDLEYTCPEEPLKEVESTMNVEGVQFKVVETIRQTRNIMGLFWLFGDPFFGLGSLSFRMRQGE